MKANFVKVRYTRTETQEGVNRRVSFTRIETGKTIQLEPEQAATLNAGKLTCAGNVNFEYLLAEGEADVADIILKPAQSGPGGRIIPSRPSGKHSGPSALRGSRTGLKKKP